MSAAERFSSGCLLALGEILMAGNAPMLTAWVIEHVGRDDEAWEDFAEALASLAAATVQLDAMLAGVPNPFISLYVPEGASHNRRLAMQMIVMQVNGDDAGRQGIIAAAREAGEVPVLCGDLSVLTRSAFRGNLVQVVDS